MPTLEIQKETSTGQVQDYLKLEIEYHTVTLKQIFEQCIRARFQLIATHVGQVTERGEYEQILNQAEQCQKGNVWSHLAPELQLQQAIYAFEKNRFMVLVDEKQITKIDEKIDLAEYSSIQFIQLIPLVGG